MVSFLAGNVNIHFLPLLIFVFVVLPAVVLITAIVKAKQINSMKRLCQSGNYKESILLANKLIKYYTHSYKLYRLKRTKTDIESFNVWLAISYLGLSEYDKFWEHINKVEEQQNLKYCWVGMYYLLQKDIEQVKLYKEKIEPMEDMSKSTALFNGVILCEQGAEDDGKKLLSETLPSLNFELTRRVVLDYTE